ncbi:ABC transporter permease [Tropicimonas sp. TH_r6]|uniref:ABC transporter permease n=1 Tax=Tropicimonas sp. TH_r6 TaxID=3082085 RepID=UPI002954C25B|nr:ABC transporter permease [Tropicimonas sp. TH_r6]MDV7141719.1 ABC transporter permease [Tropicimonas sp. TH_r6]
MKQTLTRLSSVLEIRMAGLALLIAIALSIASPYFLTASNLYNLMDQSVVVGIVAIGMTFVILTGGIDLSVGSVMGLTGILLGLALREFPIPIAIVLAIASGAFIGSISGTLVSVFGLAPFVVTLGAMAICRSLAYVVSGQRTISGLPESLERLVYDSFLGLQMNVIILILLYVLAWIYLSRMKGGRTIYAVGSNKEAARISGLNVQFYTILPYIVSGALCAVAVTLIAAQIGSIDPLAGNGMELDAIAAVVIGGASLFGGRGSIIGTLFGVLIMVMVRNGMNLLGVSPFWQGTAIGTIIIAAVLVESLLSGRSRRK